MAPGGDIEAGALVRRIVRAPSLTDPDAARARVADWLGGPDGARLAWLLAAFPSARALLEGIAYGSPYLWDLVERGGERFANLLRADPDAHLRALLAGARDAMAAATQDDAAMRVLRRMKAEAALLIALADIGGVWPVMRVTAALTDLAVASVQSELHFLLRQETVRGRLAPSDKDRPEEDRKSVV